MPLKCQSGGSKHCLSAAVPPLGLYGWGVGVGGFKQQSQRFDISASHLSSAPSHKPLPQNTNASSFLDFTASPHTITHDHTISVGFYDRDKSARAWRGGGEGEGRSGQVRIKQPPQKKSKHQRTLAGTSVTRTQNCPRHTHPPTARRPLSPCP